ncbi:MAG: NnrU family protein [Woeseiaceae bacterium]
MTMLILGLVLFLGGHSLAIFAPAKRDAWALRFGDLGWRALYGIVAVIGLILIVKGYAVARLDPVIVWLPPAWTRHLVAVLMLPTFVFLVAAYFPGKIKDKLKHPMLVSVKLWALAHLLANGMLADIILFGSFLAWAVADRISLKRRAPRASITLPKNPANDFIAVAIGLVLYFAVALKLHLWLIGVAPLSV